MIGGGLITLERARVIMYRPGLPEGERREGWGIDRDSNLEGGPGERGS